MVKPPSDQVTVGLPEEFSKAVFNVFSKKANSFKGVQVIVDTAASGVVGSSIVHFENLSNLLIKLTSIPSASDRVEIERVLKEGIDEVLAAC